MKRPAFSLLCAILLVTGCAGGPAVGSNQPAQPSSGENRSLAGMSLNILGSYHEDMVKRLAEMFEDETGCKVAYLRMPTGEGVAKLTAQKDNPTFQVYIGGTVDAHESLKEQGILAAYRSPFEHEIPPPVYRP